jgi:hypothetical protein
MDERNAVGANRVFVAWIVHESDKRASFTIVPAQTAAVGGDPYIVMFIFFDIVNPVIRDRILIAWYIKIMLDFAA